MATEKLNITTAFQQVDNSEYQFLAKFLEDVASHPAVEECFQLQIELLDIKQGDRVLDVGCGIGIQAMEMAKLVTPAGKVVGTDISTAMIDLAKSRTSNSNLPLEFLITEASSQPFPDQSFNCIRTERVLMYISDSLKVIKEFKRLLKPGGRLVIFDIHWDGVLIAHEDKTLTRKIIRYATDSFPNGHIGANLHLQLRNAGFKNINIKSFGYSGNNELWTNVVKKIYEGILQTGIMEGIFTQTEIDNWFETIDRDVESGNFFMSFHGLLAYGVNE